MIRIPPHLKPRKQESTIALINVVFLMLIFFLIAGSLAPPADRQVDYIASEREDSVPPPDMVFVRSDGTVSWRGEPVDPTAHVADWKAILSLDEGQEMAPLRIAADRDLSALELLKLLTTLRSGGIDEIVLVTERSGS
ncbi:ExbD/TolR family protein [Hoeflea sp. Naph1]|uniref:ExbD/TolR family protein n=1 Tax=Hoeflea sp. Naph1 TaxID=3388653 RepID=UPI00398FC5F5